MSAQDLKLAVIAGEVSGDLLGADLVKALRPLVMGKLSLVGVGGEGLEAEGLTSLFDYSELSIMGIAQVLARLPKLVWRIRQTARAIIAARPDILVIIDSPDFTHRVARLVRKALPDLPVVNYVCPSVWAWKPERAVNMRPYVDHVLAVLPFEPEVMQRLGGATDHLCRAPAGKRRQCAGGAGAPDQQTRRSAGGDLPAAARVARQRDRPAPA